ncbi:hypothetical protein P171DRAFT_438871 [Karstenula rhodostoma CBS 690.94]|uniref:NACHT domain-containing protein n=1 Tax=Karstenula rhodostoma CBS 690.94 TaxID=1392251 RepID=A0A9P4PWG6_9PLEO|nr:hypothetical protein P171DRAFT_438871 [Karstenula rhodostoma CBS 690.94]
METVGLVVGVIALVGVFEDCIILISQIGVAKSMAQDYVRLETKLDFQKVFLLQWADRLHIMGQNYDKRLDDEVIKSMVERGLICIRGLLQNSSELQRRYGIRPARPDDAATSLPAVSDRLMEQFRNNTKTLKLAGHLQTRPGRLPNENSTNTYSIGSKIKWVIKDKEAFECLVRELADLVTNLDRILPAKKESATGSTVLNDEIREVHDMNVLKRILQISADDADLAHVAEEALSQECSRNILNRLWFRLIDDRKNNISLQHAQTFEWAIHPPDPSAKWSDLGQWLRQGHGVYWISGKPGSGKSTLMKFLSDNRNVKHMLGDWAGDRKLTIASFFIWNLGSAEQNTQQGLARGLLYHVLNQNRLLIPVVLPGMWREAHANNGTAQLELPSISELNEAFRRLGTQATNGAYFFFVDGLDEFAGNHREGIEFIKKLTKIPNVKLLLSSRPIDSCVAAFSSKPNLRLQDLTESDITTYIQDTIRKHPYVAEFGLLTGSALDKLVEDLQKKASGVFLWVVLACRTLVDGFEAYDNAEELQRRVDALPEELEDLFRQILGRIPSRFLHQTAKLLRVCFESHSLGVEDQIYAFPLAWAEENEFDVEALSKFEPCSSKEQEIKCRRLEGRLRSRCMGLLEVHDDTVEFMHRTVFEFLKSPDVWDMDCLRIDDGGFEATAILSYMVAYLHLREKPVTEDHISLFVVFSYLRHMDDTSSTNLSENPLVNRFMSQNTFSVPFSHQFH